MRVLDLFCGMGGWSIPFIEDGDQVIGVDIVNSKYPGELILQDVSTLNPARFGGFDLIIGSPPCGDFSTMGQINKTRFRRNPPNPARGLILINAFMEFVRKAEPRFWAMENVFRAERFFQMEPIWRFKISVKGIRTLWGNITIPALVDDYHPKRNMEHDFRHLKFAQASIARAKIPYSIARLIANLVKRQLVLM